MPEPSPRDREPTVADIRSVLDDLTGYRVTYTPTRESLDIDNVGAGIDPASQGRPTGGDWGVIWIQNYKGPAAENEPYELYFHRGTAELVRKIVGALARRCGPFIVVFNNDTPILIST